MVTTILIDWRDFDFSAVSKSRIHFFFYFNHMKHLRSLELKKIHVRFLSPFFPSLIIIQQFTMLTDFSDLFFRSLHTLRQVQIHRRAESTPSGFVEKRKYWLETNDFHRSALLLLRSLHCYLSSLYWNTIQRNNSRDLGGWLSCKFSLCKSLVTLKELLK